MKKTENKVVHIFFKKEDHEEIKCKADSIGLPISKYCKALILTNLNKKESDQVNPVSEDSYIRKPRTIKNNK